MIHQREGGRMFVNGSPVAGQVRGKFYTLKMLMLTAGAGLALGVVLTAPVAFVIGYAVRVGPSPMVQTGKANGTTPAVSNAKPVTGVPLKTFLATHPKGPHTFTLECELAPSNGEVKLPHYILWLSDTSNLVRGVAADAGLLKTLSDGKKHTIALDLDWRSPWNGHEGGSTPCVVKVHR